MKVAVIGEYTTGQLDKCVSSLLGQVDVEFDVIFACCSSKYMLAYLIKSVRMHENNKIKSIEFNRNCDIDLSKNLDFVI